MIVFPNAKINIGLNITGKRADGYHNLNSCFYPVPWFDALEVIENAKFSFKSTGLKIPGNGNICINAYELLRKEFELPAIKIHLHKNIPIGAGLGGGSADGAFMIKLLNEKFNLALTISEMQFFAGKLGSDCPFFIENKPRYVEGTGDIFSGISLDLRGKFIALIYPDLHVDTKAAFKSLSIAGERPSLHSMLESLPLAKWRGEITNDFENQAPNIISELKELLYQHGAIYTSMSGSGSAVYGLFEHKPMLVTNYTSLITGL